MTNEARPQVAFLERRVHAPTTGVFVIIVTLVFAFAVVQPFSQAWLFDHLALHPVVQPAAGQLHQFVTYAVLHLSFGHWLVNILGLLILGALVEARLPHRTFIGFLIVSAFFAGLAHVLVFPLSDVGLLGASGIVAALIGFLLSSALPSRFLRYVVRFFGILALITMGIAIVTGNQPPVQGGDVGHVAHVAGLAFGIIAGGVVRVRS